jgi:hypothetical protein
LTEVWVSAGDKADIVIEHCKRGQSWRTSNQQAREFGRMLVARKAVAKVEVFQ